MRDDSYGESYTTGDVIGCFICLGEDSDNNRINFYKNGVDQGVAYRGSEVPKGIYFPAISLYRMVSSLMVAAANLIR